MMLDEYLMRTDKIAQDCLAGQRSAHEVVEAKTDRYALSDLRAQLMIDSDLGSCFGLLSTGLFSREQKSRRLALFLVTLDVEATIARMDILGRCASYEGSLLLAQLPGLAKYVRDDLIESTKLRQFDHTDVAQVPGGYARIDAMLNPAIAAWALGTFPSARVRLRLDPREGGKDRLAARLCEYIVRPPNPTWWRTLGLQRGTTDGGRFVLDPTTVRDRLRDAAFWEYHGKGVRSLDVFVKRENQGRLSMMIEELNVRDERNGFIVGRCIHLDSTNPEGTPFDEAELEHIDLAINVYENDAMRTRANQAIGEQGLVVDASHRTHLLRIDEAGFPALIDCTVGFLQSTTLVAEWLTAQFPKS